jgi:inosine/xanthosine triphosphate pyrophosphatase family protein
MAEIDLETKHSLSHRGRAFGALLKELAASGTSAKNE